MIDPLIISVLIYANLLSLLCVGYTLTYLTARIPNFAHGTMAMIGMYVSFTAATIWKINPYYTLPLASLICGIVSLSIYVLVLEPLQRFGASVISLTIATIACEMIIIAIMSIYAEWALSTYKVVTRQFTLRTFDFLLYDVPGVLIVSISLLIGLVTLLHIMLTKTMFGVFLRAVVEDPFLAIVQGVNAHLVIRVSWFFTGCLVGLAGGILPIWFVGDVVIGPTVLVSIMAGSILGGLSNIYGALLGGWMNGLIEILGNFYLASCVGPWVMPYRLLMPLTIMCITLLVLPGGITSILTSERIELLIRRMKRWYRSFW
jgi:branched-chain amino acid transport system permease protein